MATAAQPQIFVYKGKNKRGEKVEGELKGTSTSFVRAQLRRQGIIVSNVKKKSKPLLGRAKPVVPADIAVFTRMMATMMKAGVPLVQSFQIVAEGADKESLRTMINEIHDEVASGSSFASSLRKHPKYFDDLFCSLVEAGEQAGALETMLDRIAVYKEKTEALKAKIKKALTYPSIVILVAVIVTGILLVKVIPVFAETFQNFGAGLPAFTLFVLHLSDVAQQYWLFVVGIMVAAGFAFREARFRSPAFSDNVDKAMLKLPIVGEILYQAIIARFARTLSTTFAAGVPLVDALDSVAGAAGNAVYRDVIYKVRDDVTTGIQLHTSLRSSGRFPVLLLQLCSIGEESGALDDMLEKAAIHYEEAVENAVDNLTTLLEPLIMSILGILVGGLMIAMYLPIFKLGSVI